MSDYLSEGASSNCEQQLPSRSQRRSLPASQNDIPSSSSQGFPSLQNEILHSLQNEALPSSQSKSPPSSQNEALLFSKNKAFASSPSKGSPSLQNEAPLPSLSKGSPSSKNEALPSSQEEDILSYPNKDLPSSSREDLPSPQSKRLPVSLSRDHPSSQSKNLLGCPDMDHSSAYSESLQSSQRIKEVASAQSGGLPRMLSETDDPSSLDTTPLSSHTEDILSSCRGSPPSAKSRGTCPPFNKEDLSGQTEFLSSPQTKSRNSGDGRKSSGTRLHSCSLCPDKDIQGGRSQLRKHFLKHHGQHHLPGTVSVYTKSFVTFLRRPDHFSLFWIRTVFIELGSNQ